MTRHNYANGTRLERIARTALEREGWTVVRSAGSRGPVDLVALNGERVRLIQVKAAGGLKVIADALQRMSALPCPPVTSKEVWVRRDGAWQVFGPEGRLLDG